VTWRQSMKQIARYHQSGAPLTLSREQYADDSGVRFWPKQPPHTIHKKAGPTARLSPNAPTLRAATPY